MLQNLYLVIPTYNEKDNIVFLLEEIFKLTENIKVLVVDDSSPDGTAGAVKKLQGKYASKLFLLERASKQGLGSAYRQGFAYCLNKGAEVVGEMDADFSHQPQDLIGLIREIESGAEVVIGSRRVMGGLIVGWGGWRKFMSWGANNFARILLNLKTKDVTAGYRLYTKMALEKIPWINIKTNGYAWQEEMIYWCEKKKLIIKEVPVVFVDRKEGKSKLNYKDILDYFITVIRLLFI